MKGCLTLPFRLAFLALLIVGGYVAWSYRSDIRRKVHEWTAESGPPSPTGRAEPGGAAAARRKVESLRAGGRDSVVLSAADVAGLLAAGAEALVAGAVDSLEVRLDEDDVEVRGVVDTRRAPLSLGPIAGVVRDREPIAVDGRLLFRRTGLLEWQVERVRVRGIPLPKDVVEGLLRRFAGRAEGGVIAIPVSADITGLRVTRGGVTLYGRAAARAVR